MSKMEFWEHLRQLHEQSLSLALALSGAFDSITRVLSQLAAVVIRKAQALPAHSAVRLRAAQAKREWQALAGVLQALVRFQLSP